MKVAAYARTVTVNRVAAVITYVKIISLAVHSVFENGVPALAKLRVKITLENFRIQKTGIY